MANIYAFLITGRTYSKKLIGCNMENFEKYNDMYKKQEISRQSGFELLSKSISAIVFFALLGFTVHSIINLKFLFYGNIS